MAKRMPKSRQAINDAFMRLMSEKEFEPITINQIAAEANVNRGTVYLHFDDKYDLCEQCIAAEINQLLRHCMSGDDLVYNSFQNRTTWTLLNIWSSMLLSTRLC